jgi:glutamyl/glutaminyl-tRNA synthetase
MHYFIAEISQMNVPSLIASTRRAQGIYDENLTAYIKIVFRRPFAKIIDFFEGLDRVTKNGSTSEIASNSNFNKSALKKIIKDFTAKDMRKSIDILAKRVEKHFTEEKSTTDDPAGVSAGVLVEVWTACEEDLVRLTETWSSRISQWYSDSGASLDFTKTDVESAFRRQKFGA